jgi:hypothetical protein
VPRSQRPPTDEELKAERMYNFTHGRFDLMRTIPTVLEKKYAFYLYILLSSLYRGS